MKEYERFERIGTTPHRSYYIPFAENDVIRTKHGIQDRASSSRFTSLDGVWQIKKHDHVEDFEINEKLEDRIPVPACVQMHGYDHIQYLNIRYPFPVMLPHLPYENPCWHYRRTFNLKKTLGLEPMLKHTVRDTRSPFPKYGRCASFDTSFTLIRSTPYFGYTFIKSFSMIFISLSQQGEP